MRTAPAFCLVLATLGMAAPAVAADAPPEGPEALLSWSVDFGQAGRAPRSDWTLAIGYRPANPEAPSLSVFRLDGSAQSVVARLVGVPVAGTVQRVNQTDTDDWFAYTSSPLLWAWVAVGVVVTAYVVSEADDGDPNPPTTTGVGGG